jgi:KDO2-lipid IV(A) lauroyltransferase
MRRMRWRAAVDYAVYVAVRVLICVVQALSLETCERMAGGGATLFCSVLRIRYRVTEENLRHAYPEMSEAQRRRLIWRMWRHLFLMVAEIAHAQRKIHPSNWHRHIRLVREPELIRALIEPRAKVLVSGHFGNFEVAGFLLGLFGFPTTAIARDLDNPYLNRFLSRFRGGTGQKLVSKNGSAVAVAELLERGGALALLGDQAAGKRGCWINFFNRPASAHKAIALFALANEAPLIVTYARRAGRPLYFETGIQALADPSDPGYKLTTVPELTQWYSDRLEEIVNLAPEQYWWLHRRWKGQPPRRKSGELRAESGEPSRASA